MAIRLLNTLSGEKENLSIPEGRALNLFVCGPTVYDEIHIGNAKTYAVFDTLAKYLRSKKVKLFYLENITDVDDKIIARAAEASVSPPAIARRYTKSFRAMSEALRLDSVNRYAPATRFIPGIIRQVQTLIAKGNAYEVKGDGWYFDLTTFPDYGKLARRTVAQAEDGTSRIDENPGKRNRGDFCLWKFPPRNASGQSELNEPSWNAPFGKGRPGWHIEDTAITEKFFGPQYDLHGGGRDLIFPHHEAEIAQQESASEKKPFVKIWMHAGLVTVDGKKMSKSLGNFITVRDFLSKHDADAFRMLVARHHYRSLINFSESLVAETETMLASIHEFLAKLALAKKKNKEGNKRVDIEASNRAFGEAMDDDLNTPEAVAAVFTCMNEANASMWNLSRAEAKGIEHWIREKLEILGVTPAVPKIPLKIRGFAVLRERLRNNQQFIKADALRKKIEALGYTLDDTPRGPLILKSK